MPSFLVFHLELEYCDLLCDYHAHHGDDNGGYDHCIIEFASVLKIVSIIGVILLALLC